MALLHHTNKHINIIIITAITILPQSLIAWWWQIKLKVKTNITLYYLVLKLTKNSLTHALLII